MWELAERVSHWAPYAVLTFAGIVLPILVFIPAPYGRHFRAGWGPTMPARWGWVLMESPSAFLFAALVLLHPSRGDLSVMLLAALWVLHYWQRTLVYPFLMRGAARPKPLLTVVMAFGFNLLNASSNAVQLPARPLDALFVVGAAMFLVGLAINLWADHHLRSLRATRESTDYKIPTAGLYRWVSCPNYLGEMLEWIGFALAAQSWAAWAFAAFTIANLFPRALSHHRWYRATFAEYPAERRAVLPLLV